jgi:hypothetical protein
VLKHRVYFLVQAFKLIFVLPQILLVQRNSCFAVGALHHRRVSEPHILNLKFLIDLTDGVEVRVHSVDLGVLELFVPVLDEFRALFIHRTAHLANVATETGRKHILVQCWELFKDSIVKEVFCESIRLYWCQSYICELCSLARENVVISDVTECLTALCNEITLFKHIIRSFEVFNVCNLGIQLVVFELSVAVESNSIITLNNEVDFSDVLLFLVEISLFFVCFELTGHEAKRNFVQKVGVQVTARTEEALKGTH